MKKLILLLTAIAILRGIYSCSKSGKTTSGSVSSTSNNSPTSSGGTVSATSSTSNSSTGDDGDNSPQTTFPEKAFSNPALIYGGTSFANYFQALYKVGQFEQLLHFTAHESIQRYGTKSLLEKYHQMQFAYPLKLKSMTKEGGYTILNYETQKLATKRMLRLKVVIENDTTKLVIDENFLKEIGR